jgi:DNA (cytosine-5)-methyltransferase 1
VPQLRERVFVLGARRAKPVPCRATHARSQAHANGLRPPVTAGEALRGLDDPRYHEPYEVIVGRWAQHLKEIPPGWNYKHHTAWAGHPIPTFETETRFWNFLLKLSPDLPSWTIAASPGPWTGPFHWKNRRLRTIELAALQTFPRSYVFEGSRREQVRQIGNAVPVLLARSVLQSVLSLVSGSDSGQARRR